MSSRLHLVWIATAACLCLAPAGRAASAARPGTPPELTALPGRVHRIVLHVPGSPDYQRPDLRFVFLSPPRTQALWKPRFGTQWIVWTDGSVWPRHHGPGAPASWTPPADGVLDASWRRRLADEAAPVYSHVHQNNAATVGIEVAHSGRRDEPFAAGQVRSVAWLLRALLAMSEGRLTPSAIVGHKDLDPRPAYVYARCERPGCPVFVDAAGRPYRRRVDPPEALFVQLRGLGLEIPRPSAAGDVELERAEAMPAGRRPEIARLR